VAYPPPPIHSNHPPRPGRNPSTRPGTSPAVTGCGRGMPCTEATAEIQVVQPEA
jgi:hypothetical protein